MADIDSNKLVIKIVYYGPALSGKTTNIMSLHDILNPNKRGEIMTLETKNDRTLFFDLLPLGFKTESGLLVKFKLFTVPGQVSHDSTRKAVLSRADGVVFVADSQQSQSVNNGESFNNLAENAARVGLNFENMPLVVQFNKRDLPSILTEEEIKARWQAAPWPLIYSSAITGEGVIETFKALLTQVYNAVNKEHDLINKHSLDQDTFVQLAVGDLA